MLIPIYEHTLTVLDTVIDEMGHVNNVVYIQWMQDAATAHSAALGADLPYYLKLGGGWVVKSHHIEYVSPALRDDEIIIQTWVSTKGRRSSLRKFIFRNQSDGRILAKAETMWVFIDFKTARPIPIPDEVGDRFTVVPEADEPT